MTNPMPALAGIPEQIARYQLLSELGRGSMGHVYLALDPNIDRKVALKIFLPLLKVGAAEQWELRQRFVFEARAAGQLNHPGIVTIFDADTDPETGLSYLAMEWVNGPSLDDLIRESGPLSVERSTRVVEEVALALHAAHRQGLVHRDIKPANILLENSGRAKVTDFGIAKLASMSITTTGWIPGSPFYMSPEQIRNENIDRRSDLYALGAVLYQCLTGTLPFEAESLAALTHAILEIDPRPVQSINREVSDDLAAFVERALAKDPDERFDSGREFAQALQLAREGAFRASIAALRRSAVGLETADLVATDIADGRGTGTIGIAAPAVAEPETSDLEAPAEEPAPPPEGEETAPAEATPPEQEVGSPVTETLPLMEEAATSPGAGRPAGQQERAAASRSRGFAPKADPGARKSAGLRLTLAAAVILALVAVWSLRPVESQPTGATTPIARLFTPAPRFAPDAPAARGALEVPDEPAGELPEGAAEGELPAAGSTLEPPTAGERGSAAPNGQLPASKPGAGSRRPRPQPSTPAGDPAAARAPRRPGASAAPTPGAASTAAAAEAAGEAAAEGERAAVDSAMPGSSPAGTAAPRATSSLELVYRNRLKSGVLSVTVDGREVYENKVARPDGFFSSAMGKNVWTSLRLTPGEHVIDVRVTGAGGKLDLVRQTTAVFEEGRTHRLRVTVTAFRKLKLSWKESPVD